MSRNQRQSVMEMIDMMGNANDLMNMYQQLKANPAQFLGKRFNMPQDIDYNNPKAIAEHLVNTGQVSQQAYNNAMQAMSNPMVKRMFGIN